MRTVLGIDLGSTWCKAALYTPDGNLVASHRVRSHPGPTGAGAAQADLDHWWRNLADAVLPLADRGQPQAVAFSSRGFWGVFLDGSMQALEADGPAHAPREEVYAASGWGPGGPWARAYAPVLVAQLRRLRRERPELHARIYRAGALHDHLLWRLTGRWLTDPCNGPCGLDDWPEAAMELSGLPRSAFADMLPAEAVAGGLTEEAAADLGLPAGIPVACSSHDGALANLGGGAHRPGDALITLGTNTVLRVVMGSPMEGWFGYPIPPGRYAWVRGVNGTAPRVDAAGRQGEDAYRQALREVAGAVEQLLRTARSCGLHPTWFHLTGGLSNLPAMRGLLREVLEGRASHTDPEAGMRGAAMLAAVAAGWYCDLDEAAEKMRYVP